MKTYFARRRPVADMTARQTATEVVLVDYGLGNLRSVTRGLERAGADVTLTDDPADIDAAADGTPLFGICLGMQMLLTSSEEADHVGEGDVEGLDLVPGRNVRFSTDLTVPHMGWNELDVERDHPLVEGIDGEYAYFVHSYYARPDDDGAVVATTDYGVEFPSVVADETGTVFGTQFHPEKSGETGLRILRNFVDLCPS